MPNEREMLDLLTKRYTAVREGSLADRWTRAEHVKRFLSYKSPQRIADFIAVDKYPGSPYGSALAFHGHEVKVSRSDWLNELRDISKSESIKQFMHHWWLVVSDASIVKSGELPEDWGLMVLSGSNIRAKVKAPRLEPIAMPFDFVANLMSASQRTAAREVMRRDAPKVFLREWIYSCSICGVKAPCVYHQPREFANPESKTV